MRSAGRWPRQIRRIAFDSIPTLGTGEFPISGPVTVISGPNGVGKTTLLRAIWAALSPKAASGAYLTTRKLSAGSATVDLEEDKEKQSRTSVFSNSSISGTDDDSIEVVHIDLVASVDAMHRAFCAPDDIDDITNGIGYRDLTDSEIEEINYITKRNYDHIKLYEIEIDEYAIPYFEVKYGNNLYSSRTMGAGEGAAFYLWWSLHRSLEKSILLIEEPECFLSQASQAAIADHIISVAHDKKINAIISSHSAPILARFPDECIRYFIRNRNGISYIENPPPEYLQSIGIHHPVKVVAFVEDDVGDVFSRSWLELADPFLARMTEIVVRSGGESEISKTLSAMPAQLGNLRFIALYDPDMRGKVPKELRPQAAFLPGNTPLELLIRNTILNKNAQFCERIGKSNIDALLFSLEGKNYHDWIHGLAAGIGMNINQLVAIVCPIWIGTDDGREASSKAYDELQALLQLDAL